MKQNHNISDPTYDNTSQLYDYVYAFFYGFVQNFNYSYDDKTIKIGSLSSFTEYTYDGSGNADQFIQYMPFGELLVDQRASGHPRWCTNVLNAGARFHRVSY